MDSKNTESLADFVRRTRNETGLSTTDVETNSRKGGLKGISNAYVSQIENNYIQNVSTDKLKALARGLKISEEMIFAVARGVEPDEQAALDEGLARGLNRLSPGKRKLAVKQMNLLIETLADSEDNFDYGDFDTKTVNSKN